MGLAVVTVAAGGMPVVESTTGGTPVTEATNLRGVPITKVLSPKGGMPVAFETIGVAAPVSPITILTGLNGWWDASVTASMVTNGGLITNMTDQSGAGNHLGDGNNTNKPGYSATGLNSKPAMTFGGGSQSIGSTGTFPMGTGNTLTFFFVGRLESAAQASGRAISYTASGASHDYDNAGSWLISRTASTATISVSRNSVATSNATMAYTTPRRVIGTVSSGGLITIYVDGVSSATATVAGNWVSSGHIAIGSGFALPDLAFWGGAIGECGVATGFSNATVVGQLDTYLKNKWGL